MGQFDACANSLSTALEELQEVARFGEDNLIVTGCSTSEVLGSKIGSAGSHDAAKALMPVLLKWRAEHGLLLAVQGCEHINRSLVVEQVTAELYDLEVVSVVPHLKAGGAMCTTAMEMFERPVVVESLLHKAHGGIDIGNTLIGMHLRRVAIPVRLSVKTIGEAAVNFARTRPMLVGGERARYQ